MAPRQSVEIAHPLRRNEGGTATRLRILDAAEHLFAENGVDGTSLRSIMAVAGVSISQVNYHFGAKEELLRAIFERRAVPHIEQRLNLIREASKAPPEKRLTAVLEAYFEPVRWYIDGAKQVDDFSRVLARIGGDPGEMARGILAEFFDSFQHQFIAELRLLLPDLPEDDLYWRWHCLLGVLMYSQTNLDRLRQVSGNRFDLRDGDAFFDHVIPALEGALRAPPSRPRTDRTRRRSSRRA